MIGNPSLADQLQALCHCADCRKISGGNYSNNIIVPGEAFKVTKGALPIPDLNNC